MKFVFILEGSIRCVIHLLDEELSPQSSGGQEAKRSKRACVGSQSTNSCAAITERKLRVLVRTANAAVATTPMAGNGPAMIGGLVGVGLLIVGTA
jgi:hypothetical protein